MNNPTPWPAEAVAILKSEVASRTPYAQIAEVLTDAGFPASRNSVAGKIRRLYLPRYRLEQARKEPFRWSPEEVFMLRQLAKTRPHDALAEDLSDAFEREFSAKEVADKMKVLGISKPAQSQTAVDLQRFIERNRPKAPRPSRAHVSSLSDEPLVDHGSVLDLSEQTCKWPIGDPHEAGFHFCCRPAEATTPYCTYHALRAYQPSKDHRRSA